MKGNVYFKRESIFLQPTLILFLSFLLIFIIIKKIKIEFLDLYFIIPILLLCLIEYIDYRTFTRIDNQSIIHIENHILLSLFNKPWKKNKYFLWWSGGFDSKLFIKIDTKNIRTIELIDLTKKEIAKDRLKYFNVNKNRGKTIRIVLRNHLTSRLRLDEEILEEIYLTLSDPEKFVKTVKERMKKKP